VPRESFDGVMQFAAEVAKRGKHPRLRDRAAAVPGDVPVDAFFDAARVEVAKNARGLPAPLKCVDAVEGAVTLPFDEGLARERGYFIELVQSPESRALRHAFFAERASSKIPDVPDGTPTRPIRSAAVLGFGTMGGGIAMSFANAGIPVTVYEKEQAALDRGLAACRRNWEATAKKGRMTDEQVQQRLALLKPTLNFNDVGAADIVIEAVYEDMVVKQDVFARLDAVMKRGAILASNTSTLDVDRIAAATSRPQDVVGAHFFSPAK
jgi:3-hydroxyacyl-CoA dehydrogenase